MAAMNESSNQPASGNGAFALWFRTHRLGHAVPGRFVDSDHPFPMMHLMQNKALQLSLGVICVITTLLAISGNPATEDPTPARLGIAELIANREKWQGKRIEVLGYYFSAPEVSALYESEPDADPAHDARALWISWGVAPGHEDRVKWPKTGYVRVIGKFEYKSNGSGYLGRWPGQIVSLELMERILDGTVRTNSTGGSAVRK